MSGGSTFSHSFAHLLSIAAHIAAMVAPVADMAEHPTNDVEEAQTYPGVRRPEH